MVTLLLYGCTKNQHINTNIESKPDLIKNVESVTNQLGIKLDSRLFKDIVKLKTNPYTLSKALNFKKSKYASFSVDAILEEPALDTANSITYHFELIDGFELESVLIPYKSNPTEFYNYIVSGNDELGLELITKIDPELQMLSLRATGKYGGWWGCMKNFFGSDPGTFVNIMGIAGGVGCIPCAIIAAFTTGIMAIACIHG